MFIAVEMCKYPEHKMFVKDLLSRIITRADMLTDFLALYWKEGKKPICNQAKKGLAEAFIILMNTNWLNMTEIVLLN